MNKILNYIIRNHKVITCMLVLLAISPLLHAQMGEPGGDVDEVPVDGGLSLLVVAGVGYGAKRLKKARKA